jgi:hypothetical protein
MQTLRYGGVATAVVIADRLGAVTSPLDRLILVVDSVAGIFRAHGIRCSYALTDIDMRPTDAEPISNAAHLVWLPPNAVRTRRQAPVQERVWLLTHRIYSHRCRAAGTNGRGFA